MGKLLAVVVAHNEASGLFLDRPGRREVVCGHSGVGLIAVPSCVKKDRNKCSHQTDHNNVNEAAGRARTTHTQHATYLGIIVQGSSLRSAVNER